MNGPSRQLSMSANNMLAIGNPAFQGIAPAAHRPPPPAPQRPPPTPSAAHMQAQLQGMQFPGNMIQQGPQGPSSLVRRVQSQPQMNPLGGIPNGSMGIPMALSPQNQMRQAQAVHHQHQMRLQQQQQALMQADVLRNQGPNQSIPPGMARAASSQNQIMNSLGQPSSMQHPSGIQPPHHQNPFPNGPPIPPQHPPQLSTSPGPPQNHTPSPSHTPVNRPRMTPDNSNVSFMGYPGTQFPGTSPARVPSSSNPPGYPSFAPPTTPATMQMDLSQTSPPSMHPAPNRSSFTPAQPFDLMNNTQGMDIYPPSFNMGPPTNVPPRPPSHTTNHPSQPNSHQQTSLQQSQQPQQSQPHHQSPPSDQMNVHPQRPQSQPQRPPSQSGTTRTPRSMQLPLPPTNLAGSGSLTATGRLPSAQQPAGPPGSPPWLWAATIIPGQGIGKLLQFSGVLASETKTKFQLSWWSDLVREYFTPQAELRLTLWKDNMRTEAKPFQIGVPIMPRFFLVTTQSGVKSMSFTLDGARERPQQQGQVASGHTIIECVSAIWTFRYTNGYIVHLRGPLTANVIMTSTGPPGNPQASQYVMKFEELRFEVNMYEKFIALDSILGPRIQETSPRLRSMHPPTPGSSLQAQEQMDEDRRWEEPRLFISHATMPGEPVNAFGIPQATMRCLELAESVTSMGDLIAFSNDQDVGPIDALRRFANKIREQAGVPPIMNSLPLNTSMMPNNISHTTLSNTFPSYLQPMGQSATLYSSAPPSITNPSNPNPPSSSMSSPQNTSSSSANSPEKQPKTIPQQQQAPTPSHSGPASSPAVSSGGTTNTPALASATPKRKLGDTSSPTTDQPQPTTKRNPRKRGRTNTTSGPDRLFILVFLCCIAYGMAW
ncbi:LIM-domain binding protein-domain-containing protein [Gymnopilus junonius]|uniref:LIM-domain binding protein-domain-containing protein n=1 Tax=Gymnopilus junonius TaxID=109634 RepID=A0A9P5NP73_GYMJU|nr:LIM-domain binding protein-domain-containing protein [Gymnopilus junonius]